ncbi:hypothetical protein LINGRAHAP2_LOCUS31172, partial [Linum grandiflorum]
RLQILTNRRDLQLSFKGSNDVRLPSNFRGRLGRPQGTFPLLEFKVNVGCLLCSSDCKIRVSDLEFSVLRIRSWEERQGSCWDSL